MRLGSEQAVAVWAEPGKPRPAQVCAGRWPAKLEQSWGEPGGWETWGACSQRKDSEGAEYLMGSPGHSGGWGGNRLSSEVEAGRPVRGLLQ